MADIEHKRDNEFEWNQFIKLGDMMGDGLHHEADGKWIAKEYNRLAKILIPEIKERDEKIRKIRAEKRNQQIAKLVEIHKCSCGGSLKQKRLGTKVVYCELCNKRYIAIKKK